METLSVLLFSIDIIRLLTNSCDGNRTMHGKRHRMTTVLVAAELAGSMLVLLSRGKHVESLLMCAQPYHRSTHPQRIYITKKKEVRATPATTANRNGMKRVSDSRLNSRREGATAELPASFPRSSAQSTIYECEIILEGSDTIAQGFSDANDQCIPL